MSMQLSAAVSFDIEIYCTVFFGCFTVRNMTNMCVELDSRTNVYAVVGCH